MCDMDRPDYASDLVGTALPCEVMLCVSQIGSWQEGTTGINPWRQTYKRRREYSFGILLPLKEETNATHPQSEQFRFLSQQHRQITTGR